MPSAIGAIQNDVMSHNEAADVRTKLRPRRADPRRVGDSFQLCIDPAECGIGEMLALN
jgi:hypothetical protein